MSIELYEIRDAIDRHHNDALGIFCEYLSERTGRPPADIVQKGLLCTDFAYEIVELDFEDGTQLFFRHAFHIQDDETGYLGLFTEHAGYHMWPNKTGHIKVRVMDFDRVRK